MTHYGSDRGRKFVRRLWLSGPFAGAVALAVALLLPGALHAQNGTIQGRVTEAGGGPIQGAQVSLEGSTTGTTTGDDGRYTLTAPAGQRALRVLAIGYKVGSLRVTVTPGGTVTADVELTRSVLNLDEVVVTGTGGEATKRELGSSITAINLAAEVKDPPASMDQLLQARATGLNVIQSGAAAGAGAQIRLRGIVSVNQSNQPIVYIDGIRVRSEGYARNAPPTAADFTGRGNNVQASPLNDINPSDIDRIEIIKGAAAATLYGTEASNGVIQIFTKKGARGQRPRWNFEVNQGFAQTRPFGTSFNPYVNLKPRDSVIVATSGPISAATIQLAPDQSSAVSAGQCYPTPPTDGAGAPLPCDWIRNGYRQRYSGSVTGGFDQFQYFLSGGWEHNDGILPQDLEKKLNTRGNFSIDLTEKIRLEWNTAYSHDQIRNTPSGNNAQGLILNVYRWERNYRQSSNPFVLDSLLNQSITTELNRLVTGGSAYYTPFPWFTNRFTVGYDFAQQENRGLRPFGFVSYTPGRVFDEQAKFSTLTFDYAGNVDYTLTPQLKSTFTFGGQTVTNNEISTNAYGSDFAGPGEPTVSSGAVFVAQEDRLRTINAGFFFQNVFKLKERYFLTGGIRFDGNSAFGESLGLQAYPKLGFSYVLSDEPFWPSALGEMKLRGAVGYAGRAPGAFDKLRTWSPTNAVGLPGFLPNSVGDTLVGPERTREIELGADAAFFRQRLSIEATFYDHKTTDALFNVRQIPSNGFLSPRRSNVGVLGSRGFEVTPNLRVLDTPNFGWDVGGSLYTNHSRVLDLGGAVPFAASGGWVQGPDTLADGSVHYFPVAGAAGILIKNPDEIAAPDTACVASASQRCASSGFSIFGPQQPTTIWGMNTTLRLPGNITLSARGELQKGAYVYDGASANALSRSVRWPTCVRANGILLADSLGGLGGSEDDLTAWERIACVPANFSFDIFYFKQDFFKLRDLTLSVPLNSLARQFSFETATLRLSVQNYFRWYNSDLKLFDPEMTDRNSISDQSASFSEHVPPPATITASLRVTF